MRVSAMRGPDPLFTAAMAIGCILLVALAGACRSEAPVGEERTEIAAAAGGTVAVPDDPDSLPPEDPSAEGGPEPVEEEEEAPTTFLSEENRRNVTLFFQDPRRDFLRAERRQIFMTNSVADQAKQIIVELVNGPVTSNFLPTLAPETRVLGLYLDRKGTAYVDLSAEVATNHPGGTSEEVATIFSIVNSLTVNLPEVRRVHILIEGEERETLKRHLDLQRGFIKDLSIVAPGDRG